MNRELLLREKGIDLGWLSFKNNHTFTFNSLCNGESVRCDGRSKTYYSQLRLSCFITTKICSSNKDASLSNRGSTVLPLCKCIDK